MFNGQRSEDIELPHFNSDDFENRHRNTDVDEEKGKGNKNKKIIITLVVVGGVLVLGVIIFLIIYFSLKRKEEGGYIKIIHEFDAANEIKILNIDNLEQDDYSIEEVNFDSTIKIFKTNNIRILEGQNIYTINQNILKFNNNEKRDGRIIFKIKFNKMLTRIDGLFKQLNIIEADFSEFKSSKIKNMNSLFLDCINLENINFENFNSEKLESMDSTFENCKTLTELDLSSFKTPKLTSMRSTFKNCKNLTYLNVENFELNNNIIDRTNIFEGDNNLYIKNNNEETKALLDSENINGSNNTVSYRNCKVGEDGCIKCDEHNQCETCNETIGLYLKIYSTDLKLCRTCYKGCSKCSDYMYCHQCKPDYKLNEDLHKCNQDQESVSSDSGVTDDNSLFVESSNIGDIESDTTEQIIDTETEDTEAPASDRMR